MNTHSVLLRMSSPGDPGGRTPTHKMGDATKILFLDTSSYLYLFNAALRAGIMKRVGTRSLNTVLMASTSMSLLGSVKSKYISEIERVNVPDTLCREFFVVRSVTFVTGLADTKTPLIIPQSPGLSLVQAR